MLERRESSSTVWRLGTLTITRIEETCGPAAPLALIPDLPADVLVRERDWVSPTFFDQPTQKLVFSTHTWLIRTPSATILYELGAGNGKHRPNFPRAHMLETPWLERLAAAGVSPDDVDYVIASHLHTDHVGWYTRRDGDRWVPTFPRARYLVPRREWENWDPARRKVVPPFNEGVIEDCVLPVMAAGQVDLIEDGHIVAGAVRVEPAPGHTVGHVWLRTLTEGQAAILSGDVMYSPLQLVYPDCNSYACELQAEGRVTRHRLLAECQREGLLLLPSHFPEPFAAIRVTTERGRFGFVGAR
jgi:glyoxylase-like metal-dependent hydrolase (beta-lactamase superfamily II)